MMTMKTFVLTLAVWHFLGCLCLVNAWGEIGHEIVANLAWSRLNDQPKLQNRLRQILNITSSNSSSNTTTTTDDDDESLSPLAQVANWADHVRHYLPWSGSLHFIDVQDQIIQGGCHYHHDHDDDDDDASVVDDNPCLFYYDRDCVGNNCVAGAILNYSSQLLTSTSSRTSHDGDNNDQNRQHYLSSSNTLRQGHSLRGSSGATSRRLETNEIDVSKDNIHMDGIDPYHQRQALMFLVHFIGDIHQPLHVSRQSDKGGNDISVRYNLDSRSDRGMDDQQQHEHSSNHHHAKNLHSIWDTSMIETSLERLHQNNRTIMEDYLRTLLQEHPKWENHYLHSRQCDDGGGGYGLNQSCVVSWGQESWKMALRYAYTDVDGITDIVNGYTITEEYYETRIRIIHERLIAGGVRLAETIKAIYHHHLG